MTKTPPRDTCLCCGGSMKSLGYGQLQKGRYSYLFGNLDNLASGAFDVLTMVCENCGKMEFYSYDIAKPDEPAAQEQPPTVSCGRCGQDYDPGLESCPRCGSPNLKRKMTDME